MSDNMKNQNTYEVEVGKHILFFNKNYQYIFILNELLLGIEFTVASIFFLFSSTKTAGIIIFIIGSVQLLIRPILKILHAVSLRRISNDGIKRNDMESWKN